ncbi:MAG: TIGR01440 family protein [Clostridia bacterium]|nr:TIGR01440 family protein [Clostridia bacterium]
MLAEIEKESKIIIKELFEKIEEKAKIKEGSLLVVGCSTSEVLGGNIGKNSSEDVAKAIYNGIKEELDKRRVNLAAQCCEHLNRCLVVEKSVAEKMGYEIVCAVPQIHAGGSFATVTYKNMKEPVLVEEVKADYGLDIGETLIGMHLKRVTVPIRLSVNKLYKANIICAYTRPKYIGGERAKYE